MAVRNTPSNSTFEAWRVETNEIATDAGDVATLTTTATNLTAAINEHETDIAAQTGDAVAMAIALGG